MSQPPERAPYQVMPDCTPEEDEAFDADVAEHGVELPVVRDAEGNIVDGHRRHRAATRAARSYKVIVLDPGLTDVEKRTEARRRNMGRRQLAGRDRARPHADARASVQGGEGNAAID